MGLGDALSIIHCLVFIMQVTNTDMLPASRDNALDNGLESRDLHITLQPPEVQRLPVAMQRHVLINCTDSAPDLNQTLDNNDNITYLAIITSQDSHVAIPTGDHFGPDKNASSMELSIKLERGGVSSFTVKAMHIGEVIIVIRVTSQEDALEWDGMSHTLSIIEYRVTVVRKLRLADLIFDCIVAAVATLNSFSLGCMTDLDSLRVHIKQPASLLLGLVCQFLVMPAIAIALAKAVGMSADLSLGLLYVACIPGGGISHVMVSVIKGDRTLSVSINCLGTALAMGLTPLWVFGMGRFLNSLQTDSSLPHFEIWLVSSFAAYVLGMFLYRLCPNVSNAFLNWFAKPLLLLISILYVTLGVYINMYVFSLLNVSSMMASALLPICGYLVGNLVSYVARQNSESTKAIATETTISNCMLVMVMVRFSLPQPEAEITSAIPIWTTFMLPLPFILGWILNGVKRRFDHRCAKMKEKKFRQFSIVSSLFNVTNETNLSSSLSPKVSTPNEDCNCMLIDEKITVL